MDTRLSSISHQFEQPHCACDYYKNSFYPRTIEGLGGKRAKDCDDLAFRIEISPETVHFGWQICDIRKFCFALRQMTEMPYFQPHSLTVAAPSNPPPPPPIPSSYAMLTWDLCWLIARKLFVTRKQHCKFSYQFLSHKHCIGGRGGGGGLEGAATVKECGQK